MSNIIDIKKRLGRNNFDRTNGGPNGGYSNGEIRRGRALKADGKRNISKQGGYPDVITLRMHYDMAHRNGFGSNLAHSVVEDTWRVWPTIYDGDEDPERRRTSPTEFETECDELFERLDLWSKLTSLDMAQRPMRYGAMVFVVSDGGGDKGGAESKLEPQPSTEMLLDIRIYHEAQLPVDTAYQDFSSINYGKPKMFGIRVNVPGSTNEWETSGPQVHASRVFAFGEGAIDNSMYGIPCNEGCFEALMDLTKTRMSGSEAIYQNAANRYAVKVDASTVSADIMDDIAESMEDFDQEISSSAITTDSISTLQTTIFNPTFAWMNAVNECAAHHSKPMTLIIGHQTGERASQNDLKSWDVVVMDRQIKTSNVMIKKFMESLHEKFNLTRPTNRLNIIWRNLNEATEEQKVDLTNKRATANAACVKAGLQPVYSTEVMQQEAGVKIEQIIVLDGGDE